MNELIQDKRMQDERRDTAATVPQVSQLADWAVMEYSTLVLHATGIATFFLSPKHGDLQIYF